MTRDEKIQEICQNFVQSLGPPLSNAIANAIVEGYKLGWEECMSKTVDWLDVNVDEYYLEDVYRKAMEEQQ